MRWLLVSLGDSDVHLLVCFLEFAFGGALICCIAIDVNLEYDKHNFSLQVMNDMLSI